MEPQASLPKQKRKQKPAHSDNDTQTPEEQNDEEAPTRGWREKWRRMVFGQKLMVCFTFVIAVCTIIYAIVSALQWRTMRESNRINRDALITAQGALVTFSSFRTLRFVDASPNEHYWVVSPIFENTGTTAATEVIDYTNMDRLPKEPDESQFKGDAGPFRITYIGARQQQGLTPIRKPEPFIMTEELGPNFKIPLPAQPADKPLFIWGWVGYRDIFDTPHITEFCSIFRGMALKLDRTEFSWNLDQCNNHYCIDKACPDFEDLVAFIPKQSKPN